MATSLNGSAPRTILDKIWERHVVYEEPGVVAFAQLEHRRQRRNVAVHAEYAVGDDQPRSRPGLRQCLFKELEIRVRVAHYLGPR